MILDPILLQKLLKSPRDKELEEAEKYEQRLRLHAEETDTKPESDAFKDFLKNYPEKLLPEDKRNVFKALMTYPLPTVGIIQDVYEELWKVFDAKNKVDRVNFKNEELADDYNDYRKKIGETTFWKTIGWDLLQMRPGSVIVVDLAAQQSTDRPEPYFFVVPLEKIRQIKAVGKHKGELDYFIYNVSPTEEEKALGIKEKAHVYDDAFYRVMVKNEGSEDWATIIENPHDLEYTPARWFWTDTREKYKKRNPHGSQLGDLDKYLFNVGGLDHLGLYAGFPIITAYKETCTYQDAKGNPCEDGRINWEDEEGAFHSDACPVCQSKSLIGAGSIKNIAPPATREDASLMPAVEITEGDVQSIESLTKRLEANEQRIKTRIIGVGAEMGTTQAFNKDQIQSGFESKQTVLSRIGRNYELIQKFVVDTMARLRYGQDFVNSIISYGDKFFLLTEAEAYNNYNVAKNEGLPNYMLEDMRMEIIHKKFHNNPEMLERAKLLDYLEPLPDYSILNISKVGQVPQETLILKVNFNDFIKRFELENGNITEYRALLPKNVQIASIMQVLDTYVQEAMAKTQPPEPAPTPPPQ